MVETKWIKFGAVGTALVVTAGVGIGLGVTSNKSPSTASENLNHSDANADGEVRYTDPSPKVDESFGNKLSESYLVNSDRGADIVDSLETEEDPCATGGGGRRNLRNGRNLSVVSYLIVSIFLMNRLTQYLTIVSV